MESLTVQLDESQQELVERIQIRISKATDRPSFLVAQASFQHNKKQLPLATVKQLHGLLEAKFKQLGTATNSHIQVVCSACKCHVPANYINHDSTVCYLCDTRENDAHTERVKCPNCEQVSKATVEHTVPFWTFIHDCPHCQYTIMESEWQEA